jgi:hypothetical protein
VLGERITKSQEGGTQYTVALRDDNGDIMHVVEMGVRGWERKIWARSLVFHNIWTGVDPNATFRLTSILPLPQIVSIPWRSRDIPFMDYSKTIIMTRNEYIATLKHKQKRWHEVAWEKEEHKDWHRDYQKLKDKGQEVEAWGTCGRTWSNVAL